MEEPFVRVSVQTNAAVQVSCERRVVRRRTAHRSRRRVKWWGARAPACRLSSDIWCREQRVGSLIVLVGARLVPPSCGVLCVPGRVVRSTNRIHQQWTNRSVLDNGRSARKVGVNVPVLVMEPRRHRQKKQVIGRGARQRVTIPGTISGVRGSQERVR